MKKHVKAHGKYLVFMTLIIMLLICIYILREKKANYTELWRIVNELQRGLSEMKDTNEYRYFKYGIN